MPFVYNLEVYQGDSLDITDTVVTSGSTAKDLTGATIKFVVFNSSGSILSTKTIGSGITVATPANGIMVVSFTIADTTALSVGSYAYECSVVDNTSKKSHVTIGTLTVKPSKA